MNLSQLKLLAFSRKALSAFLIVTSATFSFSLDATGKELVQWGPSSTIVVGTKNSEGLSEGKVTFSDSVARNPSSGYTELSFYGGAESDGAKGIQWWRILDTGINNNDRIDFGGYTQKSGQKLTALFVWNQADFKSKREQVSSMTAFLGTAGATSAHGAARWLIEVNDEQYYVSEAFAVSRDTSDYTLDDITSVNWYALEPKSSMTEIESIPRQLQSEPITAVGIWFQMIDKRSNLSGDQSAFGRIESFSAR